MFCHWKTFRYCLAALAIIVWPAFSQGLTTEQESSLRETFEDLARGPDSEALSEAGELLADPGISDDAWRSFFEEYFRDHAFSPGLSESWRALISAVGEPAAVTSGACAAEALRAAYTAGATDPLTAYQSFTNALNWLHALNPILSPPGRREVMDAVRLALGGETAGLVPAAGHPMVETPETARAGIQLALTLAEYGRGDAQIRRAVADALGLASISRSLWTESGLFVFDNTALSEPHKASLYSLLTSIPADLHFVVAVIVPDTTGVNPAQPGLLTSGQLVYVDPIPMDVMTDPREFPSHRGRPMAPEFTIDAARKMVQAIQQVQMQRRPGLAVHRDAILMSAGETRERYLRQFAPPAMYLQQPDTLLPSVATLWFINTETAFRTAIDLFHLRQRDAVDQFLLLADLLSGGRPATVVHATNSAGVVSYSQAPLSRTHVTKLRLPGRRPGVATGAVPVDLMLIDGIQLAGHTWTFDLSPHGGVTRYMRR